MKTFSTTAALLLPCVLAAEDITTTSGKKYRDVTVTATEDNGIRITHSDGTGKIPFSELPESLRAKYRYDPERAAALTKVEEENARRQKETLKNAEEERKRQQALQTKNYGQFPVIPSTGQNQTPQGESEWFKKHLYAVNPLDPARRRYFHAFGPVLSGLPPRPLTEEERKANARLWLVLFMGAQFAQRKTISRQMRSRRLRKGSPSGEVIGASRTRSKQFSRKCRQATGQRSRALSTP